MEGKVNWLRTIKESINIPSIIAFTLGFPAMIGFTATIWNSLSLSHKAIALVLLFLIILSVGIFIWGQVRKTLYRIPQVLYKRHLRLIEISEQLKSKKLEIDEVTDFASLVNIDFTTLMSQYTDFESFSTDIPDIVEMTKSKADEAVKGSKETAEISYHFLFEKIGLKSLLEKDKIYSKLGKRLNNLMPKIPTQDIAKSISEYEKTSRYYGTLISVTEGSVDRIAQLLPLNFTLGQKVRKENLEEEMNRLLAKVWESINKYYQEH